MKLRIIDIRQLCWREELKFEKTHLLDHYQAGADTAACSLEDPPADQLQTANNTSSACHLQTTRSRPNDVAMMDTHSGISQTDQHPGHV